MSYNHPGIEFPDDRKKHPSSNPGDRKYDWSKWFRELDPNSIRLLPTDNMMLLRRGKEDTVKLGICEDNGVYIFLSQPFADLLSVKMQKYNDNIALATRETVWEWSKVTMKPVGFDDPHAKYPLVPVWQTGWSPEDLHPAIYYVEKIVRAVFKG